jgi:hypothetical protein
MQRLTGGRYPQAVRVVRIVKMYGGRVTPQFERGDSIAPVDSLHAL